MTTENIVPWLRAGTGKTPKDGGCLLQVIDWINRQEWTDQPPCVHPSLRPMAIRANDLASDADRQKLLDLAPRLMNTNNTDKYVSIGMAIFWAKQVWPIFHAEYPMDNRPLKAIEAAKTWLDSPTAAAAAAAAYAAAAYNAAAYNAAAEAAAYAAYAAEAAAYAITSAAYNAATANAAAYAADAAYAANAAADDIIVELLISGLDEFDRLTGRNTSVVNEIDYSDVVFAMQK